MRDQTDYKELPLNSVSFCFFFFFFLHLKLEWNDPPSGASHGDRVFQLARSAIRARVYRVAAHESSIEVKEKVEHRGDRDHQANESLKIDIFKM